MVVEVEFSDRDGYILASLNGMSTISDIVSAFTRIFSYSSKKKIPKMVIDCRGIENSMPVEDIARVSAKFNNIQEEYDEINQNKMTFAFLVNDIHHDPELLNEQLDQGMGSDTYIGFNLEDAEKWILAKMQ